MKKILVPTDFSENADMALNFARAVANRFASHIVLLHIYGGRYAGAETFTSNLNEIMHKDAIDGLEKQIRHITPQLEAGGGTIEGKAIKGDPISIIAKTAEKGDFDLIIMGTRGQGGLQGMLFGQTALGVIRRAPTPVVAIPSGAEPRPVHSIVFALDSKGISSPKQLDSLVTIAKIRNAKIFVFHKGDPGEATPELDPAVKTALSGLHYTYACETEGPEDISESIKEFVEKNRADMLCLIRRRRSIIERLFSENVTHDSLLESSIPILIIKELDD